MKTITYSAFLEEYDGYTEISLGDFSKLSKALAVAKAACYEKGKDKWDWIVEKYIDGKRVSVRSSVAGYES